VKALSIINVRLTFNPSKSVFEKAIPIGSFA
jgi:hypothetical protein